MGGKAGGRYKGEFKSGRMNAEVKKRRSEEVKKPVRRGADTAVPCPYMGGLIVGRLVRTF